MVDMIPAARVAAAALSQIKQAEACFPASYHETDKAAKGKIHLQVAAELLALIAPPPVMVNVHRDGTMTPIRPEDDLADIRDYGTADEPLTGDSFHVQV